MPERDPIYWDDAYPIALLLNAVHPEVDDPTSVDVSILRQWVSQLDGFVDDHESVPSGSLEQIQVEWVELK